MNTTPTAVTSPPEARHKQIGRILGPLCALGVYCLTADKLPDPARFAAASGILMAVFWITEAIPLSATALLPLVLFPILGVVDIDQAAAPFARPVVFLFLGGFMIAAAVERSELHRRVALIVIRAVGGTTGRLLAGFMVATAFLSMWISNTAATVMMIPIAASLIGMMPRDASSSMPSARAGRFELCLLLGIAYSANIGGLGTIVGTPPNALLAGFLQEHGITLGFGRWMLFAVPLVVLFLALSWLVLFRCVLNKESRTIVVSQAAIDESYRELGQVTRAQWTVLSVFLVTVGLWIAREPLTHWEWLVGMCPWVARMNDASIAIAAAVAFFLLPAGKKSGERMLDWQTASQLPWGVLVLIGGGMSLGSAMNTSGLNDAIAGNLQVILALPPVLLIVAVTGLVIFLTELVSNTAITATLLPVLFGLGAQTLDGPLSLMIPATLAASCAFMLPIGTPPNAVVFGTGRVPMQMMMRYGLWLNLIGTILIPCLMYLFGWVLLG